LLAESNDDFVLNFTAAKSFSPSKNRKKGGGGIATFFESYQTSVNLQSSMLAPPSTLSHGGINLLLRVQHDSSMNNALRNFNNKNLKMIKDPSAINLLT
jgi:hypothetical protein